MGRNKLDRSVDDGTKVKIKTLCGLIKEDIHWPLVKLRELRTLTLDEIEEDVERKTKYNKIDYTNHINEFYDKVFEDLRDEINTAIDLFKEIEGICIIDLD